MNLFLNKNSEKNFYLKPTVIQTQEVTVFARKEELKTTTVQTLTEKELDKNRGQTLGEAVEQISGITILQTGPSISKPVIRGLHSQRILLLNDGVQQEGQQWGGEHAPEIDPFSI
ncbi:Plug domain-containing protein, partial [bacterium]|nr:Plug domain-containing protein [bacterium]